MTREEAVIILDGFKHNPLFSDTHAQAFDMAISALSAKGDLISREQAIKQCGFGMTSLLIADCLRRLPSVSNSENPNKGEWIPVSERLPEERQSVLVWCPQYKNIYCACLEKGNWWIFGAFSQIVPNEVVAWQPLPEPYKAEKGGD